MGLGFIVWDVGFRVHGFRAHCVGFRVYGSLFRV